MSQVEAPTSLRERNVEARRQRILAAARDLIAEGGMDALSMRRLAGRARLSVTTLYNLVGARSDIVRALVMDAIDRMDQELDRTAPLDDPIERCRAIVTVSSGYMVEHADIFRPMLLAAHDGDAEHVRAAEPVAERAARMQARAIEVAVERGLLRDLLDPLQLGRQIYHGFDGAACQWAMGQIDAPTFEARALFGLDLALLGFARGALRGELEAELLALQKRLTPRRRTRTKRPA